MSRKYPEKKRLIERDRDWLGEGRRDKMWVLIWTALIFSAVNDGQGQTGSDSNEWNIDIDPETILVETGLCAVINCSYTHPNDFSPTAKIWCKSVSAVCESHAFIVHSRNSTRTNEDYRDRVTLLETDITQNNCSFIINDVKDIDKGKYIFRLYDSGTSRNTQNKQTKHMDTKLSINVKALSQKPSVVCPPLMEGQRATLTCIAPGLCSGSPPQITWTWRETGGNITEIKGNTTECRLENLTSIRTKHSSRLTFTPSAEHHNTNITCRVTFKDNITTEENFCLNVTSGLPFNIMAVLTDLKIIIAFLVGATLSAVICCLMRACCRNRLKSSKVSKGTAETLELVTCNEQQTTGNDQTLQQETSDRAQDNGAALTCEAEGHPKETDYASIDFSLLKEKSSEEADKKVDSNETEYSELKPEKRTKEQEYGGEVSNQVGEEGEAMIGRDERTEDSVEKTDEGTSVYSNV